ncbi:hypothetical protein E2562_018113, partial [Oryza meyeriana var. granulata]
VLVPDLAMVRPVDMVLMVVTHMLKEVAKVEAVVVDRMVVLDMVLVPVLAMVKLGDMVLMAVVHMLKVEAKVEGVAVDKMVDLGMARVLVLGMVKLVDIGPTMVDIGPMVVDMLRQVVKVVAVVVGKAVQVVVVLGVAQGAVLDPLVGIHRAFIKTKLQINGYKNATQDAHVLCI